MVLFRAFKKIAYPNKKIRFPRYRNPIQYFIGDSNRRRKKFTKYGPAIHKRVTNTTAISNITTTNQTFYLTDIDAGVGNAQRHRNEIRVQKLRFNGVIDWDTGVTPAANIRVMVCAINARSGVSSFGVQSNPYGRVDFSNIRHVYYDKTFVRHDSTLLQTKVKFNLNFHGLPIKYNSDDGEVTTIRDLVLVVVSDVAAATSDISNIRRTLTFTE